MRKVFHCLLILLTLSLPGYSQAAATGDAEAVIKSLNDGLTQAMNQPAGQSYAERESLIKPLMIQTFDYPYMAAVAIGRYWDKTPQEKRDTYVLLFEDVSVAAAASRFKPKPGTTFTLLSSRDGPNNTRVVETELKTPGGKPHKIAYLMKVNDQGQWHAIDVFYDGTVSELATKRSEYSSVVKKSGIDGLIAALSTKYQKYATE